MHARSLFWTTVATYTEVVVVTDDDYLKVSSLFRKGRLAFKRIDFIYAEFLTAMDSCDVGRRIVHQDGSTARSRLRRPSQQRPEDPEESPLNAHKGFVDDEWNHSMTFDGQVFLSKSNVTKDYLSLFLIGLQIVGLFLCAIALYFCYFHFHLFHYHVTGFYARLGHADAQHLMGDKLLHGKGVDKDEV